MIFVLITDYENTDLITTDLSVLIENINKLKDEYHCCIEFWDNQLIESLYWDKGNIDPDKIYVNIMNTLDNINQNNTIKHNITTKKDVNQCIDWDDELIDSIICHENPFNAINMYTDIMNTLCDITKNSTIKHDITVIEKDEKNIITIIDECYKNKRDGTKILVDKYTYILIYDSIKKDINLLYNLNTIIISEYLLNNLLDKYEMINDSLNHIISKDAFVAIYKNANKMILESKWNKILSKE